MFINDFHVSSRRTTSEFDKRGQHYHSIKHQFIYPYNNIGSIQIEDNEYTYKVNHLYYTPVGIPHHCKNFIGTNYTIIYFATSDAKLEKGLKSLPYEISLHNPYFTYQLFKQIQLHKSSNNPLKDFYNYGYLITLLTMLLDPSFVPPLLKDKESNANVSHIQKPDDTVTPIDLSAKLNNVFEDLIEYVNTYFRSGIDVKQMCKYSGYHRTYLFRLFKARLGTTPHRYINSLRINYAKNLLKTTNIRITDISDMSGFQLPDVFTRVFRQMEGCSPSQYRDKYKK